MCCHQWDVSYEMPIRIEEGGFPYTTLKGKLNSGMKLLTSVEHALLSGQGMLGLHVSMDHFNDDYKVCVVEGRTPRVRALLWGMGGG